MTSFCKRMIFTLFVLQVSFIYSIEEKILSTLPKIVLYPHFLSDAECDHLIRLAHPRLQRSTVISNDSSNGEVDSRRTSYGMFFDSWINDFVISAIEERIAHLTAIPKENGENIQVL